MATMRMTLMMLTPLLVLNQRIAVRLKTLTRWMILMIPRTPQMMTMMMWLISMRRIMTTMIVYLIEVEQYWVRRRMEMVMDMDRIRMHQSRWIIIVNCVFYWCYCRKQRRENRKRSAAEAYAEN